MAVVEAPGGAPEAIGLRAIPEFEGVQERGRAAGARRQSGRPRRPSASASRRPRTAFGACGPSTSPRRRTRSSSPLAAPQGREPLHQHHQPPAGGPVRGLRGPAADPRLRADGHRGPAGGAVLRADDAVPLPDSIATSSPTRSSRRSGTSPTRRLAVAGLRPEDVDFISFDHLHVQDVRFVLGTTEPIDGEAAPAPGAVPEREADRPAREWDTFEALHPMQWAWYVGDGIKDVPLRVRRPRRRRRRARQGRGPGLDPRPHRRQPLALRQHRRGRLGLLGERGRRRQLAPAPVEDPGRPRTPSTSAAR